MPIDPGCGAVHTLKKTDLVPRKPHLPMAPQSLKLGNHFLLHSGIGYLNLVERLWAHECARPVSSRRCCCIVVLLDPRGRDVMEMSHCGGALRPYLIPALWPVLSFCVYHCSLNRGTSLMASEHYSNLEVEREGRRKPWGQLILCTMSRRRGPVSSPTMDYWPDLQFQAWVSSYGSGFKINYKVVGYPYNIRVMIMWNLTRAKLQNNTLKYYIYITYIIYDVWMPWLTVTTS